MTTRNPNDPRNPGEVVVRDEDARSAAKTATTLGAIAGLLALIALVIALVNLSEEYAPKGCDPTSNYVCHPTTKTETSTTQVPSTSMSPTSVPVPTSSPSKVTTTTLVPPGS